MTPGEKELKALPVRLVQEQSTMTLATTGPDGPWAAPVYFVFMKSAFYFFSDPSSRHILEALNDGRASAAVFAFASTWQEIRGIQMSGVIETVPLGPTALKAIRTYLDKFPFTKEFFNPGHLIDLSAFSKRFRVKLYRFKPTLVYYSDNSIRFGFRERVYL